jgi:excreted virulence factor EspC (type VII ESX diderm)
MGHNGFTADPASIRDHAEQVGTLVGVVDQVTDAGQQVTPDGLDVAFGVPLQFFGQVMNAVSRLLYSAAGDLGPALRSTEQALTATAGDYAATDEQNTDRLTGIGTELGTLPEAPATTSSGADY